MTFPGLVLGINVSHDRSAVAVVDGRVVCGIAEERLDRKKHSVAVSPDGSFLCTLPEQAIRYVLAAVGATIADCRTIVVTGSVVYHPARPLRNLTIQDVREQLPAQTDPARIAILGHHDAHAIGALMASPFEEAAILVADGAGNLLPLPERRERRAIPIVEHTSFFTAGGPDLQRVKTITSRPRAMNSLGAMYQLITLFAGFGPFQEGKTMGLAPYGSEALMDYWRQAVIHDGDLSYAIAPELQTFDIRGRIIPAAFVKRFGAPRHHTETLRPIDKDLAFAAQATLERILVELACDLRRFTGSKNLVLAGGVALNSVANKKIAEQSGFENVFIVPCAADDGTALGAAFWPWRQAKGPKIWSMEQAGLGRPYTADEHLAALRENDAALIWDNPADLTDQVARELAAGAIAGWHQGGAEIGPRALGQRSILCDPRRAEAKDVLNEKVKYRESFRPFASAVLKEHAADYFDLSSASPFMLLVARAKQPERIPATVHIDGTSRVQTVTEAENGLFFRLLQDFHRRTGIPVLLNTSFNLAGDPMVETPADAIDCFLKSDMDLLALGPYLVRKKNPELSRQLAAKHRELVLAKRKIEAQEAELESIRGSRGWRLLNWVNRFRG